MSVKTALKSYYQTLQVGHAAKAWSMSKDYVQKEKRMDYSRFKKFYIQGAGKGAKLKSLEVISESESEARVQLIIYFPSNSKEENHIYILRKNSQVANSGFGGWVFYKRIEDTFR